MSMQDLDPNEFKTQDPNAHEKVGALKELSTEMKEKLARIGLIMAEESGAGTYLQRDQTPSLCKTRSKGVEVLPIKQALQKYDWLKDYSWKVIKPETDKYTMDTASAPAEIVQGYFIHGLQGKIERAPVQTCLYVESKNSKQVVHNIVIAEEGSEINIVTGCVAHGGVGRAMHEGITEFYVKKNAKITFTMIHEWQEQMEVRPRTAIILEEGASFINNYIALKPVSSIQSNPIAYLNGDNSRVMFQTILYGKGNSKMDLGSRAILKGKNTSAEMISRIITTDNADIIARGLIIGEAAGAKGHLECRGLLLSNTSRIDSIPELDAKNPDVNITHEAAVGKISQDEINYLMARGATEDEATSMIINGFLSFDLSQLPPEIAKDTKKLVDQTIKGL
ncbi:MAG: SufD family Fe-S cluster assembly protein [Candidatus Lokiarchaeota archaeon]|nr:SufD family Fe-S cluster assembly protein [Candidatus Lokiarchaeota archaeon]